jgi:hypothetical protein
MGQYQLACEHATLCVEQKNSIWMRVHVGLCAVTNGQRLLRRNPP